MLNLNDLATGDIPAITPALGSALAEAAAVCLESQGHTPGATLTVRGHANDVCLLDWTPATEQASRAWAEPANATENGAVGVAALLSKRTIGYPLIRQALHGTHIDYWLGEASEDGFQNLARLEISGIRTGNDAAVQARAREKSQRIDESDDLKTPIYVMVIEFSRPLAEVQKYERA